MVRLYHPDRFTNETDKLEALHQLTSAIHQARDQGDLKTLREIANDPQGIMRRQGWNSLSFEDSDQVADLQRMYEMLQLKVFEILESLNKLHDRPDFELQKLSVLKPDLIGEAAKTQADSIDLEINGLESEAKKLQAEIQELTGELAQPIE